MLAAATLVGYTLADDKSLATLPLAAQFLATMLTTIPASMLMGRWGRKSGFLLATIIGMLAGALAVYALLISSFWLFTLAAMGVGVFNGFGGYFRFTAAEMVAPQARGKAISTVLAGGVLAAFIGPNLANHSQFLIPEAQFAGSFAIMIGVYLLAGLVIAWTPLPKPPANPEPGSGRPLLTIMRQPRFIAAAICGMFGYSSMTLIMTATPLAMQVCGLPFSDTAFVIEWHVFAMFAPAFFTGNLIERFGVVNIMRIGAISAIACIAINLQGQQLDHFWVALVLLGISWNFLFIGATTLVTSTYQPEEKAKVQAANDFLVMTTVAIASLSAGALLHHVGWRWVNLGVLPMPVIVLILLYSLDRKNKTQHPTQT